MGKAHSKDNKTSLQKGKKEKSVVSECTAKESIKENTTLTTGKVNGINTGDKQQLSDDSDGFFMISDDRDTKNTTTDKSYILQTFQWQYGGKNVSVSGTFNEWNEKLSLEKSDDGIFKATVSVLPGTYEYKFFVDGAWRFDDKQRTITDHFGGCNNIIAVS